MRTLRQLEHNTAHMPYHGISVVSNARRDDRDRMHYTVSGRGTFPEDMLRYDRAEFASLVDMDVAGADPGAREPRQVAVIGLGCTPERWRSFGWTVHDPVIEHRYR